MIIRIDYPWVKNERSNMFYMTPNSDGVWGDLQFVDDEVDECDLLIIINYPKKDIHVKCAPENVWCVIHEPLNENYQWLTETFGFYGKVFIPHDEFIGSANNVIYTQTGLPWWSIKTYNQLLNEHPLKKNELSWVTTKKNSSEGHRKRVELLEFIQSSGLEIDLFGFDFNPLDNKADAHESYKYSIVVENYQTNHYWTEKLSDCLLNETLPLYIGCTNIHDYFSEDSIICLSSDKSEALMQIQAIIANNEWEKRINYIRAAKNKILNQYQFYPFISSQIDKFYITGKKKKQVYLPNISKMKQKKRGFVDSIIKKLFIVP